MRVAIQGFGNAGSIAAELFAEVGAKVIAVSDSSGGAMSVDGSLEVDEVIAQKRETGSVVGAHGTRSITNDELLELDCDILIPAALGNQIRQDNADRIAAKLIVEAANGPITPAADRILYDKGVVVIPDILANAGGVTVSYFEWVQNWENEQWDLEQVNDKLEIRMQRGLDAITAKHRELREQLDSLREKLDESRHRRAIPEGGLPEPDLRTACYVLAIERVARVTLQRGIWP